ncbi:hypothetical protein LB504_002513 [Fusarium proliferatum]|nr:hypothetical protein LB504_002513 [Fusarium proliferatum]
MSMTPEPSGPQHSSLPPHQLMSGLESLTASKMGLSEAISVSGRRCMHTRLSLFRLHTPTAHVRAAMQLDGPFKLHLRGVKN